MTTPTHRVAASRLASVEALRGCAAIAVVLYHVARHLDRGYGAPALRTMTKFGHGGVDLFFVISGFIILFVHADDIGRPGRLARYAGRRFSRVMPTYWVCLAITVLLGVAGRHGLPGLGRVIWSASLLPSAEEPLLGVAWTLQYEVVFYAVFGLLILNRRIGLAVLIAWFAGVAALSCGALPAPAAAPLVFAPFNVEFLLGMAVAWRVRSAPIPHAWGMFGAGVFVLTLVAVAEDAGVLNGYGAAARLAYGLPSCVLLLGLVELDRSGRLSVWPAMRALGGASYSIYLFQFVFIAIVWQTLVLAGLARPGYAWIDFPSLVGAAVGGGYVASRLVERPLLRLVRRRPVNPARGRQPAL